MHIEPRYSTDIVVRSTPVKSTEDMPLSAPVELKTELLLSSPLVIGRCVTVDQREKKVAFSLKEIAEIHRCLRRRLSPDTYKASYYWDKVIGESNYKKSDNRNVFGETLESPKFPVEVKILVPSTEEWLEFAPAVLHYLQDSGVSHNIPSELEELDRVGFYPLEEHGIGITIHPTDEAQLRKVVSDITDLLKIINPSMPSRGKIPGAYMITPHVGIQCPGLSPYSYFEAAELLNILEPLLTQVESSVLNPSKTEISGLPNFPTSDIDLTEGKLPVLEQKRTKGKITLRLREKGQGNQADSHIIEKSVEATLYKEGDYYYVFVGEECVGSMNLYETREGLRVDYLRNYSKHEQTSEWVQDKPEYKVGSSLIGLAVCESVRRGLGGRLILEARKNSVDFYKGLGFVKDSFWLNTTMSLSEKKAISLLKRKMFKPVEMTELPELPEFVQEVHKDCKEGVIKNRELYVDMAILVGMNIGAGIGTMGTDPTSRILSYKNGNEKSKEILEGKDKDYNALVSALEQVRAKLKPRVIISNSDKILSIYWAKLWSRPNISSDFPDSGINPSHLYAILDYFKQREIANEITDADLKILEYLLMSPHKHVTESVRNIISSSQIYPENLETLISKINSWDPLHRDDLFFSDMTKREKVYKVCDNSPVPNFEPHIDMGVKTLLIRLDDKSIPKDLSDDNLLKIEAEIQEQIGDRSLPSDLLLRQARICIKVT